MVEIFHVRRSFSRSRLFLYGCDIFVFSSVRKTPKKLSCFVVKKSSILFGCYQCPKKLFIQQYQQFYSSISSLSGLAAMQPGLQEFGCFITIPEMVHSLHDCLGARTLFKLDYCWNFHLQAEGKKRMKAVGKVDVPQVDNPCRSYSLAWPWILYYFCLSKKYPAWKLQACLWGLMDCFWGRRHSWRCSTWNATMQHECGMFWTSASYTLAWLMVCNWILLCSLNYSSQFIDYPNVSSPGLLCCALCLQQRRRLASALGSAA